ncbi:hypothetical protein KU306_15805 (plasmid) [Haloferax larsenii]|uniref:Uncharacterized protein n=1 Tax=Haloferax larsenii TaxID=302484 RepID=A0ABY5RLM2_HALLR|nr:hypothetical protein [Haloferax larsenii]ELZ79705.1 hypothetical protein C455_08972 [Haloferax larsenii JCM 13917]UVE52085.1 hypothetical protein KU306_15805 [Haloferax larsenii]
MVREQTLVAIALLLSAVALSSAQSDLIVSVVQNGPQAIQTVQAAAGLGLIAISVVGAAYIYYYVGS